MLKVVFEDFQQKSKLFMKNQAPRILVNILTLIYSLLCLKLWNNFKKELGCKDLLTFIAEFCLIFTLWVSRALVYNGRNLWIVDLCSVDVRLWNWRGVDEAMNFMVILHGGLNFIIQVSLWAHITSLGCRRQTIL